MRGKTNLLFILVISVSLFGGMVSAGNFTELIEYDLSTTYAVTPSIAGTNTGGTADFLSIMNIENYDHIQVIEVVEVGTSYISANTATSGSFVVKYMGTGVVLGTGSVSFVSSSDGKHDRIVYYFDSWNNYAYTGNAYCPITYTPTNCNPGLSATYGMTYQIAPCIGKSFNNVIPGVLHQTTYLTPFKGRLYVNTTPFMNGSVDITSLYFNRLVDGIGYPSTIDVRSTDEASIFINANYSPYGDSKFTYIDRYPTDITVTFGYPTEVYEWFKQITGSNPEYNITEPTVSPTPTPTPTPVPELCGYWTFALNTSNIVRNGYVQGTLTESDPSNSFDVIDWYRVLPSGQEFLMYHYVYDPGIFGLGAGWFLVDPYSGTPTASSEADAKENTLQYTTSGGAHYMRVKIFDDKSLIPTVYHDYDLVCTLNQIVYVGETTQSTSQLGVKLWEADTYAMIYGAEIHTQDKNSGEWQNKTSPYGGTVYFNVVPGNTYRILVDDPRWITYDQDYTVPSPPGEISILLKRPLPEIPDASYIHFYVKDASTYTAVMNAGITLSDGQAANTLSTGYAGFNVTDNALIYYTVSKTGYNSLTGSFQITEDTTETVYLYPKVVTTIPTTVPYWTQTPTPLATYPNGTVIPGQTTQSTPYQTLNTQARAAALTEATDPWYRNASLISNLLLLALIMGIFTLMTSGIGGRRRKR